MRKLIFMMILLPLIVIGQNEDTRILNLTHVKVKMGHEAQFAEGMKMYKKCYKENGGEDYYGVWRRVQGKNSVMAFTSSEDNWAGMDDQNDEAGNKCRHLFSDFLMPHMAGYDYSIATFMPKISKDENNSLDKAWVTYFRVKNSSDFMDVIKIVSESVKAAEGDERAYWYGFAGGGTSSPDYMVVWPFDKYADLDKDQDGVWELVEKKHGKKKLDEVREKFRNSLDDVWSYIYDRSEDLSYSKE